MYCLRVLEDKNQSVGSIVFPLKALGKGLFQDCLLTSGSLRRPLAHRSSLQSSLLTWCFSCVSSQHFPSVYVCFCVQISPFYKDTIHIGLGPTPNALVLI